MIINTSVVNRQIQLEDIHVEFDKFGIYLISGPNGSGKSSLIKQIVFGQNDAKFNTGDQEDKYNGKRCDLISYVEQDPTPYRTRVKDYIYKASTVKDDEKLASYMKQLNLDGISLRHNIMKLSGGELTKLNIIAALLKGTPYIIMDEPTNNMDNASVREFCSIIESLAKEHTFIIVSHDPRLLFEDYSSIEVDRGVEELKSHSGNKNTKESIDLKYPKGKLASRFVLSVFSLLSIFIIMFYLFISLYGNVFAYHNLFSIDESLGVKDVIVSYKVDKQYDELNTTYAKGAKLDISGDRHFKMIFLNDIVDIAHMKDVTKIILPDEEYIERISEQLYEAYREDKLPEDLNIMAIPHDLLSNFHGQITLPSDINVLRMGRLAHDNAKEIVISYELLKEHYGINKENPLGESISLNGESYTIVGIGINQLCLISYEDGKNYGYFAYEEDTIKEHLARIKRYKEEEDYVMTDGLFNTIIYTKKNSELSVLNRLLMKYPAENYISHEFERVYREYINRRGFLIILSLNLLFSLISCAFFINVLRRAVQIKMPQALSFDNYYCESGRTSRLFHRVSFWQYLVCFMLVFSISLFKYRYISKYLALNIVVFLGMHLLMGLMRRKNANT